MMSTKTAPVAGAGTVMMTGSGANAIPAKPSLNLPISVATPELSRVMSRRPPPLGDAPERAGRAVVGKPIRMAIETRTREADVDGCKDRAVGRVDGQKIEFAVKIEFVEVLGRKGSIR
jgi:hypothetical protein